jgi:hypothetical protein
MTAETEQVPSQLTQEEKRQVLRDTMHTRTIIEQNLVRGRYTSETRTLVISAAAAPVELPQPPNSYWHHDPLGPEPPLGYSIDQMNPVGEPFEVAASIGEAEAPTGHLLPEVVETAAPSGELQRSGTGLHSGAVEPGSPPSNDEKD